MERSLCLSLFPFLSFSLLKGVGEGVRRGIVCEAQAQAQACMQIGRASSGRFSAALIPVFCVLTGKSHRCFVTAVRPANVRPE